MIRGIKFLLPNEYSNYLDSIFGEIQLNINVWHIAFDEILSNSNGNLKDRLFNAAIISDELFHKSIRRDSYYIVFFNAFGYLSEQQIVDIADYEDFSKSNCQIALTICDCCFARLYCKDTALTNAIKKQVESSLKIEVEYLSEENDIERPFDL